MRRKKDEITDKLEIERILTECTVGRLATIGKDGYPYITPLNYVYWHGSIYFHCARTGEKLDNIAANSKICFEVDSPLAYIDTDFAPEEPPCEVSQLYKSVVIRGRGEVVDDQDEKVAALNCLMASHERVAEFCGITAETPAVKLCTVVAVRIESITAKANIGQKKTEAQKEKMREYLSKRDLPGDSEAVAQIK